MCCVLFYGVVFFCAGAVECFVDTYVCFVCDLLCGVCLVCLFVCVGVDVNAKSERCLCVLFVTYCVVLSGSLCCVVCGCLCVLVCSMCCVCDL